MSKAVRKYDFLMGLEVVQHPSDNWSIDVTVTLSTGERKTFLYYDLDETYDGWFFYDTSYQSYHEAPDHLRLHGGSKQDNRYFNLHKCIMWLSEYSKKLDVDNKITL